MRTRNRGHGQRMIDIGLTGALPAAEGIAISGGRT
jgi:hypothetical protein